MAHGTKYYFQYKDKNLVDTWRVELQKNAYVSTQYPITSAPQDTEIIRDRGQDAQEKERGVIVGTELVFRFTVLKSDLHKFDEIATSNYKDWKIVRKKNGVQIFEGYVKPEHFSRGFIENTDYFIQITATCGLGDLKKIDFLSTTGAVYSDSVNALTILKRCIQKAGLPELDFRVHLNTYETTYMTSTECVLDKVLFNCKRFYEIEDGRLIPWNCHDVITHVLKDWHCWVRQIDNYYYIVNPREVNSYIYEFDFATLSLPSAGRTADDLRIDITNYDFETKGLKSWFRPLKKVEVKFENRNLGETEGINGDFEDPDISFWNNVGWDFFSRESAGEPSYYLQTVEGLPSNTDIKEIVTDTFNIASFAPGDQFKVQYQIKIKALTLTSGFAKPWIYVGFEKVGSPIVEGVIQTLSIVDGDWMTITDYFPIESTGTYKVHFYVAPQSPLDYLVLYWDNIELIQERQADEITYDVITILENSNEAFDKFEPIIKFGDSAQTSDIGALKIGTDLTSAWSRFGKSESLPIALLYGLQLLSNYQEFGTIITLVIQDNNDTIRPYSLLTIPELPGVSGTDINCEIISYQRNQRTENVEVIVRELKENDASYTTSQQQLTSVDGKQSGSSSDVSFISSSYWSLGTTGIYTINNVGIGMVPTGLYQLEVANDGWIENDLVVGNQIGIGISPSYPLHVYKNIENAHLARFGGAGADYIDIYDYGIEGFRNEIFFQNSYIDGAIHLTTTSALFTNHNRLSIFCNADKISLFSELGTSLFDFNTASTYPIIQFYDNAGVASTKLYEDVVALGGAYGSLAVTGGEGSDYGGLSVDGKMVFMFSSVTSAGGIYDDVNNKKIVWGYLGGAAELHHAGNLKLVTESTGIEVTGMVNVVGANSLITLNYGLSELGYVSGWRNSVAHWLVGEGMLTDDLYITNYSAAKLYLQTSGVTAMTIDSAGKVGIGTTAPSQKFTVEATSGIVYSTVINTSLSGWAGTSVNAGGNSLVMYSAGSSYGAPWSDTQGFYVGSGRDISFFNTSILRMIIKGSNGYVGIGTTTPSDSLTVRNGTSNTHVKILSYNNTAGTEAQLTFATIASETAYEKAAIIVKNAAGSFGRSNMHFALDSSADTGNAVFSDTKMTILNNGNVGIGTTTPLSKLHLAGAVDSFLFTRTDGTYGSQWLYDGSANAFKIQVKNSSSSWVSLIEYFEGQVTTDLLLQSAGGNVGVGKTPSYTVDVNGSINATNLLVAGSNINTIYEPALGNPATSGYVLSSTTGGTRSWIAPSTLVGTLQTVTDAGASTTNDMTVSYGAYSNTIKNNSVYFSGTGSVSSDANLILYSGNTTGTARVGRINMTWGATGYMTFANKSGTTALELNDNFGVNYFKFYNSSSASTLVIGESETISALGGSVGSLAISGQTYGGYYGVSLYGRAAFIHDGSNTTGIYNDVSDHWLFKATHGAGVELYYNGTNNFQTISGGVQVNGAKVMMASLPTSDPANAGQLWNNAGTVKVSAG